jgi:G:T-mismatch repair DNA endonuclease (very short patch repair protein)
MTFQKGHRAWNKGLKGYMKGHIGYMKGKHHSKETINKILESRKGYKHLEETKIKIGEKNKGENNGMYGRHHLEHIKTKISKIAKERGFGKWMIGKKLQETTKNKMKKIWNSPEKKDFLKERRAKQIFPIKDTKPEIIIQNFLKDLKIEFFTHQYIHIEHGYQCDILIPSLNTIIECFGDYWHKYPYSREIDNIRCMELRNKGFRVLVFWENEIKVMQLEDLQNKLVHGGKEDE